MSLDNEKQLTQKFINKDKWWDILSRFIDVLRINLFIVDTQGRILLPPEEGKFGANFLLDKRYGFDLFHNPSEFSKHFHLRGAYLEAAHPFQLQFYAIPIHLKNSQVIANMIVGPIILNKRLDHQQSDALAQQYGCDAEAVWDGLSEVRVVSHLMMNSILDLLQEIVKNNIELFEREAGKVKTEKEKPAWSGLEKVAEEIYAQVRLDELLVTLLDVAMKMTNTERGSIMMLDEGKGELAVKASRGISMENVKKADQKVGGGVAGMAVQERDTFVINGTVGDSRIKRFLKRPEIKHALVMPLVVKDRVFGVLNLSTMSDDCKIEENLDNLQYLTKLLAAAF